MAQTGKKVHDLMADLIDKYSADHLALPWADAVRLHKEYYVKYGAAISGLVRHHKIDALDYNSRVDDALPLDNIIHPDPELRALLEALDRDRVRPWLFTNAYVNHGRRVVKLLGVDDLFEGITYCDYGSPDFVCKPDEAMYRKAMAEAGVVEGSPIYFVDDSWGNCRKAMELGWKTAHLVEEGQPLPAEKASQYQIRHLSELRDVFPEVFKEADTNEAGDRKIDSNGA